MIAMEIANSEIISLTSVRYDLAGFMAVPQGDSD